MWFRNHYLCDRCGTAWSDEWSATCDDDCPHCGARHMSPEASDDLTFIVEERSGRLVVLRSSDEAEDSPDYAQVASFAARDDAEAFATSLTSEITLPAS